MSFHGGIRYQNALTHLEIKAKVEREVDVRHKSSLARHGYSPQITVSETSQIIETPRSVRPRALLHDRMSLTRGCESATFLAAREQLINRCVPNHAPAPHPDDA